MIGAPPGGSRGAAANRVKAGSEEFAFEKKTGVSPSLSTPTDGVEMDTITVEANKGWSPAPVNAISLQIHQDSIPEGVE